MSEPHLTPTEIAENSTPEGSALPEQVEFYDSLPVRVGLALLLVVVFGVAFWVRYHNVVYFSGINYDFDGHRRYIEFTSGLNRIPTYENFGIGYHPPAYFRLAGYMRPIRDWAMSRMPMPHPGFFEARALTGLSSAAMLVCMSVLVLMFSPGDLLLNLFAVAYLGFLPVSLYIGSSLTNEVFYSAMTSFFLLLLLRDLARPKWVTLNTLSAGVVGALAFLSKYSFFSMILTLGCLPVMAVLWQGWKVRYTVSKVLIIVTITLAGSGWFYQRNLEKYNDPFPTDLGTDYRKLWEKRPLSFFTTFDPYCLKMPFFTQVTYTSFWTYLHTTTFFDFVGFYIAATNVREFNANESMLSHQGARVSLYNIEQGRKLVRVGFFFVAVIALGFLVGLYEMLWQRRFLPYGPLLLYLAVTFAGFSAYVTRHPLDLSNVVVKASYILSLSLPFGYFFGLGASRLTRWAPLGAYLIVFHFGFLIYYGLDVFLMPVVLNP